MSNPKYVLCQDCLKLKPFTYARHRSEELCECGGDFCGCSGCQETIEGLLAGEYRAEKLGTKKDVHRWTPEEGVGPELIVKGKVEFTPKDFFKAHYRLSRLTRNADNAVEKTSLKRVLSTVKILTAAVVCGEKEFGCVFVGDVLHFAKTSSGPGCYSPSLEQRLAFHKEWKKESCPDFSDEIPF